MLKGIYCNSLTSYSRLQTRIVNIGNVLLGGDNPIRIQSMTTTDTMNTTATVEQTIRMVDAGCEYVRITAPSINEALNLAEIKKELLLKGYKTPLIADIHFTPNAAEAAAKIIEKVRVNPGNYVDKKKFQTLEYTDQEYKDEIERIRERFLPLVKICKEYGTAMRIGTNHGSLSDRIMSRYGDTPDGMVESALEFVRICEDEGFYNIVLSMKSSNPQVMVQAYRLLIHRMEEEGMNYPLHLGVTEAGGGEDGRIKSALGIGALLEDGIGDTIRVSLTEDPEFEAPVAIALRDRYINREKHFPIPDITETSFNPFVYNKRKSISVQNIGDTNLPVVVADYSKREIKTHTDLKDIGYTYSFSTDKWNLTDTAADYIFLGSNSPDFELPLNLNSIIDFEKWNSRLERTYPYFKYSSYIKASTKSEMNFVEVELHDIMEMNFTNNIDSSVVLVLQTVNSHALSELRRAFIELENKGIHNPVIIKRDYEISKELQLLYASTDVGGLLIDGFGDGIWLVNNVEEKNEGKVLVKESIQSFNNRLSFNILQAARVRISKTEYIACPSCGRTLFDLQETTELIRQRTYHLKGVKIAIMGCIVNGPGEMADADYGYVGSGVGRITLYKGKEVIKRNIPSEQAVDELIDIIREDGKWVDIDEMII